MHVSENTPTSTAQFPHTHTHTLAATTHGVLIKCSPQRPSDHREHRQGQQQSRGRVKRCSCVGDVDGRPRGLCSAVLQQAFA